MKRMKRNKALCRAVAFLLTALMLLGVIAPALAAEGTGGPAGFESDTILIGSAEDLLALARHCTLDTWSQGRTVVLTRDISLAGADYLPIPTFGGTFEGGGHTISGLSIGGSSYPAGLFGIVQRGGVVKDLTVIGSVMPSGDADTLGGIAGINQGKLTNCAFQGLVSGNNTVGGVVGLNEGAGQLVNCSFRGVVTGEHYVGGIAGQNTGSLIQCVNDGSVNTTQVDVKTNLTGLGPDRLLAAEHMPASTDVGGVAGFSTGLMQSCRNNGDVGYEHMGYNVGGVVGRQSGYLDGCVNTGTVRGRKDVGGIAGQMEPQVTLKYSEDTLSSLWDELDVLEGLMDRALGDAEGASSAISGSMDHLTSSVGTAKDAAVGLSDAMVDWANANLDQINDASARLSWVLSQMEPVLDDLDEALEQAEIAAGQFSDALDDAELAADWGSDAVAALKDALTDLQNASGHGRDAYTHIDRAMTHLENSLGNTDKTKDALKELVDAAAGMSNAFSEITGAMSGIGDALDEVYQEAKEDENWQELRDGVDDLRSAVMEVSGALADISGALETLRQVFDDPEYGNRDLLKDAFEALKRATGHLEFAYQAFSDALAAYEEGNIHGDDGMTENLNEGMGELNDANTELQNAQSNISDIIGNVENDPRTEPALEQLADGLADLNAGLGHANEAIVKIDSALQEIEHDPRYKETADKIYDDLRDINKALDTISTASGQISHALKALNEEIDLDEIDRAWAELKRASSDLRLAADDLDEAVVDLKSALEYMQTAGEYISGAADGLSKASDTMGEAISLLRRAAEQTTDIITVLAEKPAIQFTPIGSDLTERGDALDGALSQVLEQVEDLNHTMSSASDLLLADLRAINRQVGVIIDLLRQVSDEAKMDKSSDRFEDVSDQELWDDQTSGRISNARNDGRVEGDINVAGVVGSMAIEYDFDPEDDLTESGDRSLDFRYRAVAVVRDSVNAGTVKAKKDCAGGIVGRLDLGTVYACQGYGSVESTGGDFVGGIAGLSRAAVRNSFAKCTLSGESCIGGIVGAGEEDSITQGCYSLVRVTDFEQYAGAISGTETGEFNGNCFVSEELAGLGRVSYAGKAEPITYQTLSEVEGLPDPFRSFTLTFTADDAVLKSVSFDFGACFGDDIYPDIPEKDGFYARWDVQELSDLRFDTEVKAVYAPYITALSAPIVRDSGRPVFYVEGDFQSGDRMEARVLEESSVDFKALPQTRFREQSLLELWRIRVPDDGQAVHTVRYLRPGEGGGHLRIYIRRDGTWQRVKGEENGRYLAFPVEGGQAEIAVFALSLSRWAWILVALPLLLLLCVLWNIRRTRKRKRNTAGVKMEAEEESGCLSSRELR